MDEEVLNVEYDDQSDELVFITNSNALPEDIQKLVDEFSENIDEEDLKAAKKNLCQLKEILGEEHPRVTWAEATLELEELPLGD